MSKKEPSYPLKALDKSLAILEILSQENSPLSIAAPIKDHRGTVMAAVSLSVPAFRMNASKKNMIRIEHFSVGNVSIEIIIDLTQKTLKSGEDEDSQSEQE